MDRYIVAASQFLKPGDIRDILGPTAGTLVLEQIGQADHCNLYAIDFDCLPIREAGIEIDTGNRSENFDLKWLGAHTDDRVKGKKIVAINARASEAELMQHADESFRILHVNGNPDIDIARCTDVAVRTDRVTPDQEILNLV